MNGFILLHRSLLDWEWYDDHNTCRLFLHLLMQANFEDKYWHGILVKRGQVLTSKNTLVDETGISGQSIKTALSHLKSTNEITTEATNNYTIVTICKYDYYQAENFDAIQQTNQPSNQELTNDYPTTNQRLTTTKQYNNITKEQGNKEQDVSQPAKRRQAFKADLSFIGDAVWEELIKGWLDYKQARGEKYKSDESIKALYLKLQQLSGGDIETARQVVMQSMSNNWAGLFALKQTKEKERQPIDIDRCIEAGIALQRKYGTRPI